MVTRNELKRGIESLASGNYERIEHRQRQKTRGVG